MRPTQTSLFDFDDSSGQPLPEKDTAPQKKRVKESLPVATVPKNIYADEIPAAPIDFTAITPVASIDSTTVQPIAKKILPAADAIKPKSTRGRKSLKEMNASVHLVNVPEDEVLFQKKYYSMGKVAEMFAVTNSLLRVWANEFDVLKPMKNGKGDRHFRPEDVKNIQLIYHLLREKKYTMEGAKNFFKNNKKADEKFAMIESLKKIKGFLLELKANL